MAALIGWFARPFPQRLDQPPFSLLQLLETNSTVGSNAQPAIDPLQRAENVVPKVPPDADQVPMEIRVGLDSQRPITAFWPGRKVLCRNEQGLVIPAQQLGNRITSFNQQEIQCSVGPVEINQKTYLGDVLLLKNQRDWFP